MQLTDEQVEQVRAQIAEWEAERDQLVQQANQRIAWLNGKIEAYREMVAPQEETEKTKVPESDGKGKRAGKAS